MKKKSANNHHLKTQAIYGILIASLLCVLSATPAAAKPPGNIDNACSIFKEKRGWYRAARKAEKRWKVSISIGMAFVRQESAFVRNAKPPRKKFLLIFPSFKRRSSSVGYSQAIKGAWAQYRKQTGRKRASRRNFRDSLDFIGWFNHRSHKKLKIPKNDPYNLYLAYHEGIGGYKSMKWTKNKPLKAIARKVEKYATTYAKQLAKCKKRR